jgi:hypothetical protein
MRERCVYLLRFPAVARAGDPLVRIDRGTVT